MTGPATAAVARSENAARVKAVRRGKRETCSGWVMADPGLCHYTMPRIGENLLIHPVEILSFLIMGWKRGGMSRPAGYGAFALPERRVHSGGFSWGPPGRVLQGS